MSNLVLSSNSNVLVLTETWLCSDVYDSEVLTDLPNFTVFRKDRAGSRGGGVLIAVSQQLSCSAVNIPSELEILFILCHAAPQSVILGVCYRPPRNSTDFARNLNNALNIVCSRYPNQPSSFWRL